MKTFAEALAGWDHDEGGPLVRLPVDGGPLVEVRLEPLLYGQYLVAVYVDGSLMADKVPVYPGGTAAAAEAHGRAAGEGRS